MRLSVFHQYEHLGTRATEPWISVDTDPLKAGEFMMKLLKHSVAFVLCCSLVGTLDASADQGAFVSQVNQTALPPPAQAMQQPSEQLQQLVAPIALYADPLVAQILAASTYPAEVVEAWRWMQGHPGLKGQQLADAVDPQPWDPSVKALTQFPSVLDNMNTNLHWTSTLGDAYVNQQEDVLNAVQVMRQRAQTAGSLQSTSQQSVTTQGQTIEIEPTDPEVVYVPAYDPWLVYGAPLGVYPDWVAVPGIYYAGSGLYFGVGFGVGLFAAFGWGWHHWGFDWHGRRMTYNHAPYISHSRTFVNRHNFDRAGAHFNQTGPFRGGGPARTPAFHPQAGAQIHPGVRSGTFSGFDHGGIVRGYASRGRSSFGAGFHAGEAHAGGSRGGEGHR
jgi:hypothetical protein